MSFESAREFQAAVVGSEPEIDPVPVNKRRVTRINVLSPLDERLGCQRHIIGRIFVETDLILIIFCDHYSLLCTIRTAPFMSINMVYLDKKVDTVQRQICTSLCGYG